MKFFKFFGIAAVVAMVSLTSCNKDPKAEVDPTDGSYLSINIVSNPVSMTKAGGDQTTGDPNGTAIYEEGTTAENKVASVRFFFFKKGEPVACVYGDKNWIDYTPTEGGKQMPNVEKELSAVVVLKKAAADAAATTGNIAPDEVIVVVNPAKAAGLPTDKTALVSKAVLRGIEEDYTKTVGTDCGFVMSNTVYKNSDGNEVFSTSIDPGKNISTERAKAVANPIKIYVERCVAKVRVKYNVAKDYIEFGGKDGKCVVLKDATGKWAIKVKDPTSSDPKDSIQVFASIPGWDITAITKKGYLSKQINKDWAANLFCANKTTVSTPWTYDAYFRSYWAINPKDAGQEYHKYEGDEEYPLQKIDGATVLYTNENAAEDAKTGLQRPWPTQVMVPGTLVDENGNALTICEFAGDKFVAPLGNDGKPVFDDLKLQMVNLSNIYIRTDETTGGEKIQRYTKIGPDDVEIVTALSNGSALAGQDNKGRYNVELKIQTKVAKNYTLSNTKDSPKATEAQLNAALKQIGHAKVWNEGKTYWFFPIYHLGENNDPKTLEVGETGVVRNHIYDCSINRIGGFGTPIYDPDEPVYPEKPQDDDAFISATIEILSWRVVTTAVELVW